MIAPLSSQYRTRTQHPVAAYRVGVDQPGRVGTNDRLEWNRDPLGGRLLYTYWSKLPAAGIFDLERGDKVHNRRGRRPNHRLHVDVLHNGLLLLRHAVLRLLGIVGLADTTGRAAGKRVRRGAALRGRTIRVYGEESGLVLRRGKPDHRRDHQPDTNPERDCGA